MTDSTAVAAKTRAAFGNLIKKPPLTDKLLSRPPFRFLHDVISATIRESGFLNGLFTPDELDSTKVTDKDAKIRFLQKVIDATQFASQQTVHAKPAKIVSGQDFEQTNDFLQKFAQSAHSFSPDGNSEIVRKVLAGEKPGAQLNSAGSTGSNKENREASAEKIDRIDSQKSATKVKKSPSSSKERGGEKKKHSKTQPDSEERRKHHREKEDDDQKEKKEKKEKTKESKDSTKEKKHHSSSSKEKRSSSKEKSTKPKEKTEKKSRKSDLSPPKNSNSPLLQPKEQNGLMPNGHAFAYEAQDIDEHNSEEFFGNAEETLVKKSVSAAKTSLNKEEQNYTVDAKPEKPSGSQDSDNKSRLTRSARPGTAAGSRPGTSLGRPSTARAAPPRLKRRELGEVEPTAARDGSAKSQGGETVNLIISQPGGDKSDKDDDEDIFIVEEPSEYLASGNDGLPLASDDDDITVDADRLNADEHGGLVRRILETKKELESGLAEDRGLNERHLAVYDEKEREKTRKETTGLQDTVQQLTRTAHPLARLVDFMQEDIDSMLKELEQWREEYKTSLATLKQVQGAESVDLDPLRSKLVELDQQIGQKRDAIAAVRGSIIATEEKLKNLINTVGR